MTEEETVKSLDNVLTRLALTQEANLQKVLWNLMPIVIRQLKQPGNAIRSKVLEILSHVNKRIEGNSTIVLPLESLVEVFQEADTLNNPLMKNLALVYIETAFYTTEPKIRLQVFPDLMKNIFSRNSDQRYILLRLAVAALAHYQDSPPPLYAQPTPELADARPSSSKKPKTESKESLFNSRMFQFLENKENQRMFLEFAHWTLLFQIDELLPSTIELPGKDGRPVEIEDAVYSIIKAVPPGLSLNQAKFVQGKKILSQEELIMRKIGILNYLKHLNFCKEWKILFFLIASSDLNNEVQKLGESLLKKHFRIEMDSKDIDLNSEALISKIMKLFQGSSASESHVETLSPNNANLFMLPASHSLKSALFGILSKSLKAANLFPGNIDIILSCVFGLNVPMKLRLQAMEFSVWVLKHSNDENLHQLAAPMLNELLVLLKSGSLSTQQKGYAYEAIGQLAQRTPETFSDKIQITADLFKALESEPAGVRSQLQSAVSCLSYAFKTMDADTEKEIKSLLMRSMQNQHSIVRLVSITWCLKLFPFDNCFARYICILGAGDDRAEVCNEASLGLTPASFFKETKQPISSSFPDMSTFLSFLLNETEWMQRRKDTTTAAKIHEILVKFLRNCVGQEDLTEHSLVQLLTIYEGAVVKGNADSLIVAALQSIVALFAHQIEPISQHYTKKLSFLMNWIYHRNNLVRQACGRIIGAACLHLSLDASHELIFDVSENLKSNERSSFEQKDGALWALGYIAAFSNCEDVLKDVSRIVMKTFGALLTSADASLGSTLAMSLGLQILNKDYFGVLKAQWTTENGVEGFDKWYMNEFAERILNFCKMDNIRVATKSATGLGFMCKGFYGSFVEIENFILSGLVSMQHIKHEEIQLAISEALALGFSKQYISNDVLLKTNYTSLREANLSSQTFPSDWSPSSIDYHGDTLDALLEGLSHSRVDNRRSCVSHLVTLMTYCSHHPQILQRLEQAQSALLGLLGDKDDITQETASRSISLVYNLSDDNMKKKLLSNLTSVLKDPTRQAKKVKLEADSKIFEEGQLGKIPGGGSLTTYKELCSLATDMGQPDLIYKFMDLANHQTALNSRRGAAVGFTHIAGLAAKEDLDPLLKSIAPRIYRLQFDPNPKVQESMQNIWQALVSDSKTIIADTLESILSELLTEIGSHLWRNRESSCKALSEILQGKQWTQVSKYFYQFWKSAFRAMDDIKESVRVAGSQLAKVMKRITLKFIDSHQTDNLDDVQEAISITLPVLLDTILHSTVEEISSLTFSTLSAVASSCPTDLLRIHLPALVPPLLESLSGLENQQLNYVEQHATTVGVDMDKLDSLRISASSQSPAGAVLDRCVKIVDPTVLEAGELLQKLKDLIKRGVGLNTKVGTLRFIAQIAMYNGSDFSPYAQSLLNVIILKALAGEISSSAIKKAYAQTLGSIAKFSDKKAVSKMVNHCISSFKSQENVDQHIIGLIFKELYLQAPEEFLGHGSEIIPIAFCARFDPRKSVSAVWSTILEEGTGTESGAIRLYHEEIIQEIHFSFNSTSWSVKAAASQAIKRLYETDAERVKHYSKDLVELLLSQLQGRLWDGKEALLAALSAICQKTPTELSELDGKIIEALKNASSKGKKEYRNQAIDCLAVVMDSFSINVESLQAIIPYLIDTLKQQLEVNLLLDAEKEKLENTPELSVSGLLRCLANLMSKPNVSLDQEELFMKSLPLFYEVLVKPYPWHQKKEALRLLMMIIQASSSTLAQFSDLVCNLYKGVFITLCDQKYMEVRSTSLDTIRVMLNVSLPKPESVVEDLENALKTEKSIQIRSRIENLLKELKQ